MKRFAICLLSLCFITATVFSASAQGVACFVLNSNVESAKCGEEIIVTVELSNTTGKGISAFDCSLGYDSDRLKVKEITPIGNVVGKDFQFSNPEDGVVKFIFCEVDPLPVETTEFLDIKFTVLDNALNGEAIVRVTGGSLCDKDAKDVTGDLFTDVIVKIDSENTTAPITTKTQDTTVEDVTVENTTVKETISLKGVYEKEQEPAKIPPVVWVMIAVAVVALLWIVISRKQSKK